MEFNFKIQNDRLIAGNVLSGNSGNVGTYICKFNNLDNNLLWFCVFKKGETVYQQVIEGSSCVIPIEVLEASGDIQIGCYGTDGEIRISTNWLTFSVADGAYSQATAPKEPTPDVWETLVMNSVPYIGESGNWYVYDKEKREYVDSGVSATGGSGDANVKSSFIANAIKETVIGEAIVLKDISPITGELTIKLDSYTPETKVFKVGQNVWDEEWERTNGNAIVCSKNLIRVVPGANYYFYCNSPAFSVEEYGTDLFYNFVYYDKNKQKMNINNTPNSAKRDSEITIPDGCHYITFWVHEAYGNSYKNDICINVSDKKINGTYAPYSKTEHIPNADGEAVIKAPFNNTISLFTEEEITLECEYSKDTESAIANAVANVGKNWELISSGTLTEEVSSLAIDGFSCSKVNLCVEVKGSANNSMTSALRFRTNANANAGGGSNVQLASVFEKDESETVTLHIPLEMKNKWITGQLISSTGANANVNYINKTNYDSIKGLYLQPVQNSCVFGVGTTYELWGVRE